MTGMTSGHELKDLDAMNGLGLWMTWTNSSCELKALDAMNNFGLRVVEDMNNSKSWT